MVKRIFLLVTVFVSLMGIYITASATSMEDALSVNFNFVNCMPPMEKGDNWYKLIVERNCDIYVEVNMKVGHDAAYAELYYSDGSYKTLISSDYTQYVSKFYLEVENAKAGEYYILLYNPQEFNSEILEIFAESFSVDESEGLNNWIRYATRLPTDSEWIISDNITFNGYDNMDIDIYRYTASRPCRLIVGLTEYENSVLDIYIGDILIASTDETADALKYFKRGNYYTFNVTHGNCYFKIRDGEGNYTLEIRKENYQSEPFFYNIEPVEGQFISEFDTITPKLAIIGNDGPVNLLAFYVRNGKTWTERTYDFIISSNKYKEYDFSDINDDEIIGEKTSEQNTIQFQVWNQTGIQVFANRIIELNYDETPPEYESIDIHKNNDSIEIIVNDANDKNGLAIRPYRYRIYEKGISQPEYTKWSSSTYYNYGIEGEQLKRGCTYIIDVQIRDKIAEIYQNTDNDLSNHITLYSEEILIN